MDEIADEPFTQVESRFVQKLQARRRVAQLLHELIQADDPMLVEAHRTALLAAGRDLLPTIGPILETADPRAISRLGSLAAAYPDRPAAVALLRHAALDPHNSDLRRMATMVVLEQFLEQELGGQFFATLRDPAQVAVDSLVQVLRSAQRDRNLLLAYLSALEEQHPAALRTVLDSLGHLSGEQGIEILKLLAQHQDEDLAAAACRRLAAERSSTALRALRMLELVAPPARRPAVQRALRKLVLAGVGLPAWAPRLPGARALLTGIDSAGASTLWFVVPCGAGQVQLLSLLLSDTDGLTDAFGGDSFSAESFPPSAPLGTIHRGLEPRAAPGDSRAPPAPADADDAALRLTDDDPPAELLEVDFDYARRLVSEYQQLNSTGSAVLPWEYRLLHDIIWRFGPPPSLPLAAPRPAGRSREIGALLALPYFAAWRLRHDEVYRLADAALAGQPGRRPPPGPPGLADSGPESLPRALRAAAQSLAATFFTAEQCALYARRLARSAEWLQQAGQAAAAGLTWRAAAEFAAGVVDANPFARLLAERSLVLAAQDLLGGVDSRTRAPAGES